MRAPHSRRRMFFLMALSLSVGVAIGVSLFPSLPSASQERIADLNVKVRNALDGAPPGPTISHLQPASCPIDAEWSFRRAPNGESYWACLNAAAGTIDFYEADQASLSGEYDGLLDCGGGGQATWTVVTTSTAGVDTSFTGFVDIVACTEFLEESAATRTVRDLFSRMTAGDALGALQYSAFNYESAVSIDTTLFSSVVTLSNITVSTLSCDTSTCTVRISANGSGSFGGLQFSEAVRREYRLMRGDSPTGLVVVGHSDL